MDASSALLAQMEKALTSLERSLAHLELPPEEDSLIGKALAQALFGVRRARNRLRLSAGSRANVIDDRPRAPWQSGNNAV